mmetsp:Transcript_151514/g.267379  ORF Transcript_151514/g.267379 Transcript_151514/m.267379 type:complete len:82 (-) Transcript_151514:21-266(-)
MEGQRKLEMQRLRSRQKSRLKAKRSPRLGQKPHLRQRRKRSFEEEAISQPYRLVVVKVDEDSRAAFASGSKTLISNNFPYK